MIWISKKLSLILIALVVLSSFSAATTHQEPAFEIPEYEDNEDLLLNLIAPFLLVYLILQLGFYITFQHMLGVDNSPHPKREKNTARKYSSLIALVTSLMVIVSPFFEQITQITFLLFGTITNLILLGAIVMFLYIILK